MGIENFRLTNLNLNLNFSLTFTCFCFESKNLKTYKDTINIQTVLDDLIIPDYRKSIGIRRCSCFGPPDCRWPSRGRRRSRNRNRKRTPIRRTRDCDDKLPDSGTKICKRGNKSSRKVFVTCNEISGFACYSRSFVPKIMWCEYWIAKPQIGNSVLLHEQEVRFHEN